MTSPSPVTLLLSMVNSKKRRRQSEMFSEFFAVREGSTGVRLMGLIGPGVDPVEATQACKDLIAGLRGKARMPITAESGAVTAIDVPLALYLDAYKLDLDQLTWSRRASEQAAEPSR